MASRNDSRLLRRGVTCALLALLPLGALVAADAPEASPSPSASPTPAAPGTTFAAEATPAPALLAPNTKVSFFAPAGVVWLGQPMIIPFKLSQPAGSDQAVSANIGDPTMVEVLRPATVLTGETTGFVRVRGLRLGKTRLVLHGDAALDVEVKTDPAAAAFVPIDAESGRPHIVAPVPDSVVWGTFAVAVDVFDATMHPSVSSDITHSGPAPNANPPPSVSTLKVQLRLPNGKLLDPVASTGPEVGPQRHFQFNVNADEFAPGPLALRVVASPDGGNDLEHRAGRVGTPQESTPVVVRVFRPMPNSLVSGECENPAIMGDSKELIAPARPAAVHLNKRVPDVGNDAEASGGKNVRLTGGNDAWCLPFDVQNPGDYQVIIQAKGDFAAGAWPTAALYTDTAEMPVTSVRLAGPKYQRMPVGEPVHLGPGPQVLTVAFRNDYNHGKEDRNLYLDRFEIARVGDSAPPLPKHQDNHHAPASVLPSPSPAGIDLAALKISVLYPAANAEIFGADAVVARVASAAGPVHPAWVDLVVDGQPQGERLSGVATTADMLVFPLIARQLPAGKHEVAVRLADVGGQTIDSPVQTVKVLERAPFLPGQYDRAIFLLDRLAFGPEPRELAAVLTLGESAWLNNRLAASFDTSAEQAVLRNACEKYPHLDDEKQTSERALAQWIGSDNPVRSRFSAWTENHFSTWVNKTKAAPKWHEHLDFCWVGVASFADLLSVSAHSPAMLAYLDQEKSYANKLNENYAREIMELHTLGVHGGYKQIDVTALASVLNGWTTTNEAILPQVDAPLHLTYNAGNEAGIWRDFRFDPFLNDGKTRRVFGLQFAASNDAATRYDNIRLAMEMLAAHPSTADHVCRKLAEHYVGVPAPEALVGAMAKTYLGNGGDMRAVMRTMVAQREFWNAPMKMATPFDFGLRVARVCRAAVVQNGGNPDQSPNADQIESFLKKSGMGLFDRVTPDGYPENNGNYADSNALLQRWRFMQSIGEHLNRVVPANWRTPPAGVTPAANEAPSGAYGPPPVADPLQRFIDLASVRLTGHLLDNGSNQSAREVLGEGNPDQMRETILFVAMLPETSLR